VQLLIATREPDRFASWVEFLKQNGIETFVAAPDRRSIGEALRLQIPAIAVLDLADGRVSAPEFRKLLSHLYLGHGIGLLAALTNERIWSVSSEDCDDVLDVGAAPSEVLYRVRRVAERIHRHPPAIELGDLVLRPAERQVILDARPILLWHREFELLRFLAARPNRVFRREELAREVWGPAFRGSPRTVDAHMCRLRKRLGRFGQQHLQTVRGVGYRLAIENGKRVVPEA
jgi:DNA-binding response OmpR family regulator